MPQHLCAAVTQAYSATVDAVCIIQRAILVAIHLTVLVGEFGLWLPCDDLGPLLSQ